MAPETFVDPQTVLPKGEAGTAALAGMLNQLLKQSAAPIQVAPSKSDAYMDRRIRVTLEMEGGTYVVPAIDVKVSRYGVIVALPSGPNDVSFTPKPGAEVTVRYAPGLQGGERAYECYYPGTAVDWPELKLSIIVFVRKTEG